MKRAYLLLRSGLLLLLACVVHRSKAQTSFDENGKLVVFKVSGNKLKDIVITDYDQQDLAIKKEARTILLKKIDETLKVYQSHYYKPYVRDLYERLWPGQSATLIASLNEIKAALKSPTPGNLAALSPELKASIDSNLLPASKKVYYSTDYNTSHAIKLNLWKRDPFNGFVVDYYNNTIAQAPSDITYDIKIAEMNYLKQLLYQLSQLLEKARTLDHFDDAIYLQMINMDLAITSGDPTLAAIKKRFEAPWFKKWFWFRGGEITLNPLDFTTADFLAKNPSYDITKSAILNQYVDTMINRLIRYDTAARVDEFIQLLRLKGSGGEVFKLQAQNDSLNKLNSSRRALLLTTDQLLNKVSIPATGDFYNFSAISDQKFDIDQASLKQPIHTYESKSIALHNILTLATAYLQESDKSFADKSRFQEGFDTVVTQLGQLAAVIGKFSPYGPLIDLFAGKRHFDNGNIVYPVNTVAEASAGKAIIIINVLDLGLINIHYSSGSDQLLYSLLRVKLHEKRLLNNDLFSSYFPKGNDKRLTEITPSEIPQLRGQLNSYLAAVFTKTIQILQADSVFLVQLVQIYNQSTLPETDPLTPITNKTPVYYSKLLETKRSDDAVERTVEIYTVKNKDTSRLDKFTYKVGKNYRIKLGAGIAYTLNSYDQSEAKESNGQITVTNNAQQIRFIAGIHYYFGKGLFLQNSDLLRWKERNSLFIGVGFPNPLGNVYFALSHDLVPGLQTAAGVHVSRSNKYFIQNNAILEESVRYRGAGPFVSVMIDPTGFINLLNLSKKQ